MEAAVNKIEKLIKHNKFFQAVYVFTFSLVFKFLGLFIRPKKIILFQSLIGKNFGESPKVLFDLIVSDPFFKDFKCIWAFENPDRHPECPTDKVKLNSFKYFKTALKSKIWISNTGIERGLHFKHKGTIHLNTDHGFAFKKCGNAQKNRSDYNFKNVDFFCCCSEIDKKIKVRDYKLKDESARVVGFPINDVFFKDNSGLREELRKRFEIPKDKKVILYAPTWRDDYYASKHPDFIPIHIEKWEKALGDKYVFFLRGHHLSSGTKPFESGGFLKDGYTGISVEEMLILSDILISDYSAISFNYSILEKPIVAYVYDNKEYQETRGTYIDPFDVFKGSCFKNEDDVIEHILNMNYELESKKTKDIHHKYMVGDGHTAECCINYLKDRLDKNGKK